MPSREWELGWAAGLFEGEGCFAISRNRATSVNLRARMVSTDEETIRSFHRIIGVGNATGPKKPRTTNHQPFWVWEATGPSVEIVYALIGDGLGSRRRGRYAELLAIRRDYESRIPQLRSDAANRSWTTRRRLAIGDDELLSHLTLERARLIVGYLERVETYYQRVDAKGGEATDPSEL